jgi:hypothetical protein
MPETKPLWVPSPGDEVYLENGDIAQYIAPLDGRHVVRVMWESTPSDEEPGEPQYGEPIMVPRVFEEAPVAQKNERIAKLDREISEKSQQLRTLQGELSRSEALGRARIEALKKHDGLQRLEDFLEGRITHFVLCDGAHDAPVILDPLAALGSKDEGRYSNVKPLKLLTLYGKTKGDLQWRISQYSDGSGHSGYRCIPCCSLEEAQAAARVEFQRIFEEARKERKGILIYLEEIETAAAALGVEVPRDLILASLNRKFEELRVNTTRAQADLDVNLARQRAISDRLKAMEGQEHAD